MGSNERTGEIRIFSRQCVSIGRLPSYPSEVHSLFDQLIHHAWGKTQWHPDVDVVETRDEYRVKVDLPGVDPERIDVRAEGHHLIISGTRRAKAFDEPLRVHVVERPVGDFYRTVDFGRPVGRSNISKEYENGVLTVIVSKS